VTGTEDYYRRRAAEYDRVYAKPERQADLTSVREWLPSQLAGRRVLEIAAGTGYWTEVFAGHAASTVATDINPAPLDLARARLSGWTNVRFVEADAFDLDPLDGSFDAAFVGFFWSHVPRAAIGAFLEGLAHRLEPGAAIVILDNRYVDGSNHPISRTDHDGNTYQRRTLEDGTEWEVLKNFPSQDFLQAALEPHTSAVSLTRWTYYWAATCTL
jgi:ubiquinone/menaquinone biosynthesis C-methylase UbiE